MTGPDLTPEQEAVRRLLAEARHDVPVPADVVARLDTTLASLVAERSTASEAGSTPGGTVVDLGSRRRRAAAIGVLAAAAVVVAGVALGQVLPSGSDDSGGATSAADSSTSRELEGQSGDDAGGQGDSSQLAPESLKSAAPFAGTPTLSAGDPALDEELLAARSAATHAAQDSTAPGPDDACELPPLGRGRQLVAEVDGQDGLVVFRRPDGAAQQVDLYVCGLPDPVRTLTLPAP